ncbi:hypothetical protein [Euzebya sp.]|uniref:hypothetical protein n=1 Tax=Euzebya sp. TaxID=1971409 RepID=UPI0035167E81
MSTAALILATEGGIPTSNPWSQLAVPLGIVIFVGTVYMLLRSNLGTRRGYLVMSSCLWGFGFLLSLFWTFGAPGTPPNTGPQNLPGQELDEYQPVWVAFAPDSALATEEGTPYAAVADFPDGDWGPVPEGFTDTAQTGAENISSFFAGLADVDEAYTNVLTGTEVQEGETLYAEASNGRPMIGITLVNTCELIDDPEAPEDEEAPEQVLPPNCAGLEVGDPVPAGESDAPGAVARTEYTLFGFYDAGAPYFPSLLMTGIMFVLFVLHTLLLARDEQRERREAAEAAAEDVATEERATVGV